MNSQDFRRAALGLTIHGPFSRNRRRRREVRPLFFTGVVFSTGLLVGLVAGLLAG